VPNRHRAHRRNEGPASPDQPVSERGSRNNGFTISFRVPAGAVREQLAAANAMDGFEESDPISASDAGNSEERLFTPGPRGPGEISEKELAIQRANEEFAKAAAHAEQQDQEMALMRRGMKKLAMEDVPPEMICPISNDLMKDPVICADGHTYEREAIQKWIRRKASSPMTNQRLQEPVQLIPNHALRSLISNFVDSKGGWGALVDQ